MVPSVAYELESVRRTLAWDQLTRIVRAFEYVPAIVQDQLLDLTRDAEQRSCRYGTIGVLLEEDVELATHQLRFVFGDLLRAYGGQPHLTTIICCTDEQVHLYRSLRQEYALAASQFRIIRRNQAKPLYDLGRLLEEAEERQTVRPLVFPIGFVIPDCRYVQASNLLAGAFAKRGGTGLVPILMPWFAAGRASTRDLLAAQAEVADDLERGFGRWPD